MGPGSVRRMSPESAKNQLGTGVGVGDTQHPGPGFVIWRKNKSCFALYNHMLSLAGIRWDGVGGGHMEVVGE